MAKSSRYKSYLLTAVLAVLSLGLLATTASATDLIVDLDQVVVTVHDYSTINGLITKSASSSTIQQAASQMNTQLFAIKSALKVLDTDITKNWTYLGVKANGVYPARDTLRSFDLAAYSWYNYELKAQKSIGNCYKNVKTSKACVLKLKSEFKKAELARYSKVTAQLNIIEKWRLAAKR